VLPRGEGASNECPGPAISRPTSKQIAWMNTFFHIGLHKTATSWFQHQLFPNLDGVRVLHTKHIGEIALPTEGPLTLIVSHEKLSGRLSPHRQPGDNFKRLVGNLELIAATAPRGAIIVGFREHTSWLHSAFSERAKRESGLTSEQYLKTFSLEDLSWSRWLPLMERSCASIFPFLYEEFRLRPNALINDLCKFLRKEPPPNVNRLLAVRENLSPRSSAGQLVSRTLFNLSKARQRQSLTRHCYRLGTWVDRFFPARAIELDAETASYLQRDWNTLVRLVGERRGQDFWAP
jgi:hypothetical protein